MRKLSLTSETLSHSLHATSAVVFRACCFVTPTQYTTSLHSSVPCPAQIKGYRIPFTTKEIYAIMHKCIRICICTDVHGTPCHVWLVNMEVGHAYGRARNAVSRMERGDGSRSAFLYLSCRGN